MCTKISITSRSTHPLTHLLLTHKRDEDRAVAVAADGVQQLPEDVRGVQTSALPRSCAALESRAELAVEPREALEESVKEPRHKIAQYVRRTIHINASPTAGLPTWVFTPCVAA